MQFNI